RSQLSPSLFNVRRWTLGVERLLLTFPFPQPRYSARYFARNERAAAPRTLAAARPVNNFRNKDLASFFSCSETRACSIAAITFSIASVTPACLAALGCDGLVAVVRRSRPRSEEG